MSDPRFLPFSGGPGLCFVADYWFNKEAGWRSSASSGFEIQNALHFLVSWDSFVLRLFKSHGHHPGWQACSTRDEIEATASLEFIALYVMRSFDNVKHTSLLLLLSFSGKKSSASLPVL